jgi:CheY-like chemotaxis protein
MQKTILLIDDDEDEYSIMAEALHMAGIDAICRWAENANAAYHLLKNIIPDLVLIDYNMPVINGLICLQELRKHPLLNHTPMVIYSTSIDRHTQREALSLGATACIQKTVSVQALVNDLKRLFVDVIEH